MTRATALPPDERRAAILAAVVDLLLERGPRVSTRDIAVAAGVAEGTLFRVFADKESMVDAALDAAMDPGPLDRALAEIPDDLPPEDQLRRAVVLLQERVSRLWALVAAVGVRGRSVHRQTDGLVALLRRSGLPLTCSPEEAAATISAVVVALTHPSMYPDAPMPAAEVVALVLHGLSR